MSIMVSCINHLHDIVILFSVFSILRCLISSFTSLLPRVRLNSMLLCYAMTLYALHPPPPMYDVQNINKYDVQAIWTRYFRCWCQSKFLEHFNVLQWVSLTLFFFYLYLLISHFLYHFNKKKNQFRGGLSNGICVSKDWNKSFSQIWYS